MASSLAFLFHAILSAAATIRAADEDLLQDFCIAEDFIAVTNGFTCKAEADTRPEDFIFSGLNTPDTITGAAVTSPFVGDFPGVNSLGLSIARIDYAAGGLNPPHTHPRATELLFVLEGTLEVGFVSSKTNTPYLQRLTKGDLFVFPIALLHFQKNVGNVPASVLVAFTSQNPGAQQAAKELLASGLPTGILEQTIGVNQKQVKKMDKYYHE